MEHLGFMQYIRREAMVFNTLVTKWWRTRSPREGKQMKRDLWLFQLSAWNEFPSAIHSCYKREPRWRRTNSELRWNGTKAARVCRQYQNEGRYIERESLRSAEGSPGVFGRVLISVYTWGNYLRPGKETVPYVHVVQEIVLVLTGQVGKTHAMICGALHRVLRYVLPQW